MVLTVNDRRRAFPVLGVCPMAAVAPHLTGVNVCTISMPGPPLSQIFEGQQGPKALTLAKKDRSFRSPGSTFE